MHNACMSQGSLQRRCLLLAGLAPIRNYKQRSAALEAVRQCLGSRVAIIFCLPRALPSGTKCPAWQPVLPDMHTLHAPTAASPATAVMPMQGGVSLLQQ